MHAKGRLSKEVEDLLELLMVYLITSTMKMCDSSDEGCRL